MAKNFSISSKQIGVIITLVILLALGASYFLVYVPNNEKAVQERHFRSLQNIDNNIHAKINNDTSLINNLLFKYNDAASLRRFITKNKYADSLSAHQAPLTPADKKQRGNLSLAITDAGNVDDAQNTFTLTASRYIPKKDYRLQINGEQTIDRFIRPLLPADIFDQYIVFYEKKENSSQLNVKVYETFRSGLNCHSDSLLEKKNGISLPGIRSLTVGGTEYKIFSQPVNLLGQRWIISGLVTSRNYEKEKNELPLWIVLLLLTAAIGIIVCIPWIKLYHMGSKDKLTARDAIASVLVSMVLMSLLFFVFFKYNFTFGILQKKHSPHPKDTLVKQIDSAFSRELRSACQTLIRYDEAYCANGAKPNDITIKPTPPDINFHQVYWVSDKTPKNLFGIEINNWSADVSIPKHTNFSMRDYFVNIKNNKPNLIVTINSNYEKNKPDPGSKLPQKEKYTKLSNPKAVSRSFYLSQNISKVSGAFTSVIATRSLADGTIAAIGFKAKTLDHVVMPDGYMFAIIDGTGEVRYHSKPELNLNQNLKTEFADSSQLVSSIEAKSDTDFQADYLGKRYNVEIAPFPGLPYHIVIFENLDYSDTRDMEAYAFTLSMLLCLLVFLIVEIAVVFFTSSKRSLFKKQVFETSWVAPKISSHREYNMAIVANFLIIALMIIYFKSVFGKGFSFIKTSFLEYIYIILFSILLSSLVLNGIYARKYWINKCYKFRFKIKAIVSTLVFMIVVDIAAYKTLYDKHFVYLLYYEVLSLALCAALVFLMPAILSGLRRFKLKLPLKWEFSESFTLMSTTRLIITSGIPVAFFFIYSYDYEQNLDTRYRQYHFAAELIDKNISENRPPEYPGHGVPLAPGIYSDRVAVNNIHLTSNRDSIISHTRYWRENYLTANVLDAFRFNINNIEIKNDNMSTPSIDSVAFFNRLTSEQKADTVTQTFYRINPKKYLVIRSANTNYTEPNWVLLILAIVLFTLIKHQIIRKIFALHLSSGHDEWEKINRDLISKNELNSLLLIVGSPGSGKLSNLKDIIASGGIKGKNNEELIYDENDEPEYKKNKAENKKHVSKNNVFIADMLLIPAGSADCGNDEDDTPWKQCLDEALDDKYKLVIINHFEYNMKDGKTNNMKLDLLEKLMINKKSKVMIISTVHPVSFLDSYNQQIRKSNKELADDKKADQANPENELERWMVLFGHFRIVIEPLIDYKKTEDEAVEPVEDNTADQLAAHDIPVKSFADSCELPIMHEIRYSHFLHKMEDIIPKDIATNTKKIGLQSDSVIFKLQLTSQYFYTYIWQSLTMEEKFLLYDLAEDGLVNSYDDYNLSVLISKKLIVKSDGTLMLFNKGFRNFILTAIGETEVNIIKKQVKANGNWDSLKMPLVITMVAILVFLFASQQEAYSRIITYITAFSAGIPTVLKIFSLFSNSSAKGSS